MKRMIVGSLFTIILFLLSNTISADVIIHIQHPWADDSARAANPPYIQSGETGWHPGKEMVLEGGGWYTYTLKNVTPESDTRFEIMSVIPSQNYDYSNSAEYAGGTDQLIFSTIFEEQTSVNEFWMTVTDLDSWPEIKFTPPPTKAVYFFKPWDLGGGGIQVDSLMTTRMRAVEGKCGWFVYRHLGDAEELKVRFFNPVDSTAYSTTGLNDQSFMDLSRSFSDGDSIWIVPDPLPDGPPLILTSAPDIDGDCPTITLAAQLRDIGDHPDFGTDDCSGHRTGMVETKLSPEGKPVRTEESCAEQFEDWYVAQDLEDGYTNEKCRNLRLKKNSEGLYELDSRAFYPLDDFEYLDPEQTIPNPNFTPLGGNSHNYYFTMELGCEFEYVEGQTFYFRGDDDVWVFIDSQLVVDIGGIHNPTEGAVDLDTLNLIEGETYSFKLFFAERHCCGSNFRMVTSIDLRTSSALFSRRDTLSTGGIRHDIYQLMVSGNYACGFEKEIADTQEAKVDFYISGPSFSQPQKLSAGLSYEGISISEEQVSVTIDTTAIDGLIPGEYTIAYFLINDPSQEGSIRFIVPETEKPPLEPNPVLDAAFFADNGIGQVDRAELYYQRNLTRLPDSITVFWSSQNQATVYREQMIHDTTDLSHLTLLLNDSFEENRTTCRDSCFGISYTRDTLYHPESDNQHFELKDSVGPLLSLAVLPERRVPGNDTLLLLFSEKVFGTSCLGTSLRLQKPDGLIAELEVISYFMRSDTIVVITDNQDGPAVAEGDLLSILPNGPLKDRFGNAAHPDNRPVAVLLRRKAPLVQYGWYTDSNADGFIDRAVLRFDTPPQISDMNLTVSRKTTVSTVEAQNIMLGSDSSEIIIDIEGYLPGNTVFTGGAIQYSLDFNSFEKNTLSDYLADSAAPVISAARLYPSVNRTEESRDTLNVRFSETISDNIEMIERPFLFTKSDGSVYTVRLKYLHPVDHATIRFLVKEYEGVDFPSESDMICIASEAGVEDFQSNTQSNPANRKAALEIKPIPIEYAVKTGPNPFDPAQSVLTIIVEPLVNISGLVDYTVDFAIYDHLAKRIHSSFYHCDRFEEKIVQIFWDGTNSNGRVVGSGSYVAILSIRNLRDQTIRREKIMLGVKR